MRKIILIIIFLFLITGATYTQEAASSGQTIYLPAYSSIYFGDKKREFDLAVTLSIRNTNLKNSIKLDKISFYNSAGKMLKHVVAEARTLNPLESVQYVIDESDLAGGVGANFIIKWSAAKKVNAPIVESIMIGTKNQQGISFTSRGVVIDENL